MTSIQVLYILNACLPRLSAGFEGVFEFALGCCFAGRDDDTAFDY